MEASTKRNNNTSSSVLPIIEQHTLLIDLGECVIKTALNQRSSWSELGIEMPASVNISPLQLQQSDFVERLTLILQDYTHFKPGQIEFEILETSALDNIKWLKMS